LESNPATADKEKLKTLRELGINRLSIGAQSFNDQHLKTLGRIHNSKDIFRFYDDARSAGFDNINLDLIFALPGQTLAEWKKDLQAAIDLKPNHISTYNLQIEENTPLWEMTKSQAPNPKQSPNPKIQIPKRDGEPRRLVSGGPQLQLPNEEIELAMYEYAIETLASAGYKHYEISNFAKPGFECQHNINYWKNGNYIGIGAGAHSHLSGKRWSNPNCIEGYMRQASGETGNVMRDVLRITQDDSPDATDQRETIFMGLRLLDGLSVNNFKGYEKEVKELTNDGLLELDGDHYKLSKKGLYLGNLVFEKFV
jgi:oxygen-independent coproporphyrinogen-3 oxidase